MASLAHVQAPLTASIESPKCSSWSRAREAMVTITVPPTVTPSARSVSTPHRRRAEKTLREDFQRFWSGIYYLIYL